jgi:hypothetical protein
MNYADFNTQPDGFPLESDATLGFMQSSYLDGLRALAKIVAGDQACIVTGVEISGGSASAGWIYYDGDLVYFQAGTVSDYFIIEETAEQKANQNGTLVDRYFTKVAKFGTGPDQVPFSLLTRINHMEAIGNYMHYMATGGEFGGADRWVILDGLEPQGSPAGNTGISSGIAMYSGYVMSVASYGSQVTAVSPVYLKPDGTWTGSSDSTYLTFNPFSTRRLTAVYRTNMAPQGQIIWVDDDINDISDRFDGSGLGKWEWDGWAIANGNNGTTDRTSAISGLTPIVKL